MRGYAMETNLIKIEDDAEREKQICLEEFEQYLTQSGYSAKTIKNYKQVILSLQRHYPERILSELCDEEIWEFLRQSNWSTSYKNVVISSIKLLFDCYPRKGGSKSNSLLINRPATLPQSVSYLSKNEVKSLLEHLENIKHKAIAMLIYGCGLKVCDILRIHTDDVCFQTAEIHITECSTTLSKRVYLPVTLISVLMDYIDMCKPQLWLFEGKTPRQQYAERSIQNFIMKAAMQAKIEHHITATILRNSYAVHFLSNGTGTIEQLHYSLNTKDKRVSLKFADAAILKRNGHHMNPLDALFHISELMAAICLVLSILSDFELFSEIQLLI